MDSESVDRCIQKVLSSLYPPFLATSATVLCQVLSVVDNCYRGDGVRYLLHFLLPAKYLLEALQQHSVQSCDEGWPLCIQEKLVVHLCPVDQHVLLPGDFYLLVSPPLGVHSRSSSPCLFLCSVSEGNGYVEQQEVAEVTLRSLFTMAWLDSVNRERERRGASRLQCCVLTANRDVFRVPWEDVVYPQLLSRSQSHDQHQDMSSSIQEEVKPHLSTKSNQSGVSSEAEDSEGEYVELTELKVVKELTEVKDLTEVKVVKELTEVKEVTEATEAKEQKEVMEAKEVKEQKEETLPRFSPQRGSLTQAISRQLQARSNTHTRTHSTHKHTSDNTHTHSTHRHTSDNTHTHSTHRHTSDNTPTHTHTPDNTHTHSTHRHTSDNTHTHSTHRHTSDNTHTHTHTPDNTQTHSTHRHTTDNAHTRTHATQTHTPAQTNTPDNAHTHRDTPDKTCTQTHRHTPDKTQRHKPDNTQTHTHRHTPDKTRTQTHRHTHDKTQRHKHDNTQTHTHRHTPDNTQTHTHRHTPDKTHTQTHRHTPDKTQTQRHKHDNTQTHTHRHTPDKTRTQTHRHKPDNTQTHTQRHTPDNTQTHTHRHKPDNTQTHTHRHTPDNTQTHTHRHKPDNTQTHTHRHTADKTQTHTRRHSHTHPSRLCEVMEEMMSQDSCGASILSSSSSSAPPEVTGTSSQEQTPGTEVVALREEEEEEREEKERNEEEEEHVSGYEVLEREEEEVRGETQEEGDPCEEEGQVFMVQLSQEREKKQVMEGKEDEEERGTCINTQRTPSQDSYCENTRTHSEDSYCENTRTHSEDSYCGNTTTHPHDSYCGKCIAPPCLEPEESVRAVSISSSQLKTEVCVEEQKEYSCEEEEEQKEQSCEEEEEQKEHSCEGEKEYSCKEEEEQKEQSCEEEEEQKEHSCEGEKEQKEQSCKEEEEQKEQSCKEEEEQKEQSCKEEEEQKEQSCKEEEEQKEQSCKEEEVQKVQSCKEEEEQKEQSCKEEEEQKEQSFKEEEEQKEQSFKEEEGQKEHSCEEEEHSCEELVGGRGADLQIKGLTTVLPGDQSHLRVFNSPTQQQPLLDQSAAASVSKSRSQSPQLSQCLQSSQSSFYSVLLSSGALCLPGTTDRNGRALVMVNTWSSVWSNSECEGAELLRLLLYYRSTLREEVRALGLTVLVDARRAAPVPALFSALRSLQDQTPGSVHTVLLLVNRDTLCMRVDKPPISQVQVLTSLKSLHRQVALQQLPAELGGSFSFSQSSWLCFRSRVEQLTSQCDDVINLLQKTISILETTPLPASAQKAELLLSRYKELMRGVLKDDRLVRLQQEGGASLSWLRKEVREVWQTAVEAVSSLYDQVDELLHSLVTLSNTRTKQLSFILDFRSLEDGFNEVSTWLQEEAEPRLKSLSQTEDSLQLVIDKQQQFKEFSTTAYEYCKRGESLLTRLERWDDVSSADLHVYKVKVHSFWAKLQDFSQRVNDTGQNIERAVQLYTFLDQAYGWAFAGLRYLAGINMDECSLPDTCQAVIGSLQDYQSRHPPITNARFQEMRAVAEELRGERGVSQWSFASSKCQETKKMFDRKMEAALRTRDSTQRRCSDPAPSISSTSSRKKISSGLWGIRDSSSSSYPMEVDTNTSPACSSSLSQRTPFLPRLDSSPSFFSSRRQQLRKTQSFDAAPPEAPRYGPCSRALSEPVRRGNTGVFIRGLEVSSTEATDRTLCPRTPTHSWVGPVGRSPGTPTAEPRPKGSKLRHMVEEMVTTEREYVRSLRYIIHHYFPEMERADLPQDLRGKRSVVFGNLEKLLDFHSQFFLRELESCWRHPLRVSHCFLRHQQQFALYALYSKNKPKSDALLLNHGNFFRRKQLQLGDKMDLLSYLLKPIQRMSKYALLLSDIIKEVGVTQEAELNVLQAATNMVKFQLRHGNDLLAMDAIRDCDVNLKEQGQLIRQDEFTIWSGRRKCQRHIFLFEELVLFSKPKKMEGGLDVFIYKHSFKTADVGLTESSGDSGLRFEIWFRRRTSKNQTFILQSTSLDIKHAWTSDITRILWTQANRNKEMRRKEMVSMGVGSKPFLDIQPSDSAISDRAVDYIMKSRGARTRASIAVSVLDVNPFKRGLVTSDPRSSGSSSSSASLLGSLNLHMFSQSLVSAADSSFISSCVEEDEQELETSSQPSMTTDSSGSSSHCLSGSTGSDSGCVSSHLQEALPEEPRLPHLPSPSSPFNREHMFISAKPAVVISPSTVV